MNIKRQGDGPRVFFGLHGWSGDYRTYAPLTADLPDDVSFFSADLPGCGASAAPSSWTIEAVADEIASAILKLQSPVTLVGNCSGANIGFFVAQRLGARLLRLVTIDAFADWPWYFRVFVNPTFGRYAYFSTFENPLGRWITNLSLSGKRTQDTSLTAGFQRVDHRATYRYLTILREGGDVEQFRGLKMPIDITFGQNSFAEVKTSAETFKTMWPQARVSCLPGAGHLPILEATAALRQILFYPEMHSQDTKGTECTSQLASYAN